MSIPPEALKEYLKLHLFKEYDLSPELREQHDIEMELWRKRNK